MSKVIIVMAGGCISIDEKPDDVEIVVKDYDVDGSWDEDNERCKLDKDGCRYQEMLFPATQKKTTVVLDPITEDEPITVTNFYKCDSCNTEWEDQWSCACDDECPDCGVTYSPYKSEDIRAFIGWQPSADDFDFGVGGLNSFEVYENLEHGKDCHTEVKKWIPIYEDDIEAVIIIPFDGENEK